MVGACPAHRVRRPRARWSWGAEERVFHPVDIGRLIRTAQFNEHWASLSTTGWLFKLVKPEHQLALALLAHVLPARIAGLEECGAWLAGKGPRAVVLVLHPMLA